MNLIALSSFTHVVARNVFLEQIFDWSDYYSENLHATPTSCEALRVSNAITELWIKFASFEIELRQFKKAVDVFEKALSVTYFVILNPRLSHHFLYSKDTLVAAQLKIYISYADFCVERNKLANAQKVRT